MVGRIPEVLSGAMGNQMGQTIAWQSKKTSLPQSKTLHPGPQGSLFKKRPYGPVLKGRQTLRQVQTSLSVTGHQSGPGPGRTAPGRPPQRAKLQGADHRVAVKRNDTTTNQDTTPRIERQTRSRSGPSGLSHGGTSPPVGPLTLRGGFWCLRRSPSG